MPGLTDEQIEALEAKEKPAKQGLTDDEIEALEMKEKAAAPKAPTADSYAMDAANALRYAGRKGLEYAGKASEGLKHVTDQIFTTKPIRGAIDSIQKKGLSGAGEAAGRFFLPDLFPDAPKTKELLEQAGVDGTQYKTPLIMGYEQDPVTGKVRQKHVTLSPSGVAAGVADTLVDPLTYVPFEKIPAAMLKAGVEGGAAVGRGVAKKAGNVIAGVPESSTAHYLENSARVNAAKPAEEIEHSINRGVKGVQDDAAGAAGRAKAAADDLDKAYADKMTDLKGKTASVEEARNIMAAIDQEKSVLGSLSKQADDALVRSGVQFSKKDLIALVDGAGKSLGEDIVGKQAKEAVANLAELRQVVQGLPNNIPPERLRNIMRQLRDDLDYNGRAGAFNSANNRVLKHVTRGMSDALKTSSPEYAAYMGRMADLADVTEDMSRHFGTETGAIGALEAVRKGGGAKSQVTADVLKRYAEATGNKDLLKRLGELEGNRAMLEQMKGGDLRAQLFPDKAKDIAEKQADAAMAADVEEKISRLTPGTVQSKIKNQGTKNPSNIDRRALEDLGNVTGEDYATQIKDRNVLDDFDKDATRGSRLTNLGIAGGAYLGHKVGGGPGAAAGGFLGGAIGATGDKYAGVAFKKALDGGIAVRSGADKAYQALIAAPAKLGKYQRVLREAANKGPKAFILYHHLLMQNDPEYRAIYEEPAPTP